MHKGSGYFQFVLQNRNLNFLSTMNKPKKICLQIPSLYVMSHIFHQGIAVLHSNGTWTSIMSDNKNDCHLCLVYVSDGPNTGDTFFPIECIPLDGPLHPEHPDSSQQRKTKAGSSASKRCQVKGSTPSKSGKKTAAQEPTPDTKLNNKFPCNLSKPVKTTAAPETCPQIGDVGKNRLKLHLKPSALQPSPKILQLPSEAAPRTQLPDLPHQGSQVSTRSKSKAGKVTDSKFCIISSCLLFYHTIYHFYIENSKHPPPVCFIYCIIYCFWTKLSHFVYFLYSKCVYIFLFCLIYKER